MRIKIISALLKKEITDIVRDKKSLMAMIGIPLIMYPLMMIGFLFIMQVTTAEAQSDSTVILMQGEIPQEFKNYIREENENELVQFVESITAEQESEYTLVFEENGDIEIEYDSTIEVQGFTRSDFTEFFDNYRLYILNNTLSENNIEVDTFNEVNFTDIASNTQSFGMLLGQILPMLLMLGVTLGIITSATDIVSGEKERKTIETLLSLPVTSLEIVSAKFIAISIIGITTALANIISMALSLGYILLSLTQGDTQNSMFSGLQFSQLAMPVLITSLALITFTFFVSALTMTIVSMAKTFKEAQNYVGPLMLVLVFPSYVTMIPTFELNNVTSFIPVVNISLLIKDLFNFNAQITDIFIVIVSNIIYSVLAIIILGKVYSNENIMFGNKRNFRLIESRSTMQKGGTPKLTDGIVLFTAGIVMLFYLSGVLSSFIKSTETVLALQQLFVLVLPILYCVYIKADFIKTFAINRFKIIYLLIGIPLTAAALTLTTLVQNIMIAYFPTLEEMVELIGDTVAFDSLILQIIVICVMPAICEEMFFRGFVLHALNVKKHPVASILITSLMFGVFHMNVLQFVTGLVLGTVLGFVTYKSKSIFPAVILHFLNNFTAVLLEYVG